MEPGEGFEERWEAGGREDGREGGFEGREVVRGEGEAEVLF